MKIRTLIVDDEPLGRKLIRKLLEGETEFEIIGECADGRSAVVSINRHRPDLVFLDVQMPELGGFEVLEQVEQMPVVIFVTAYDQFALKAFEAHALDYLLKPFDEERFYKALTRVKAHFSGHEAAALTARLTQLLEDLPSSRKAISRIAVKSGGKVVFIRISDIDWIEAAENYVQLHVGNQQYLVRGRMNELEKQLNGDQFFRIHRSTIVNLDRVKECNPMFKGEAEVLLKDGTRLAVSRGCSQKLQESLAPNF
jgi:two-component system LytT family response regulator